MKGFRRDSFRVALTCLLVVAASATALTAAQEKTAAIDALLDGYHLRGEFNGSALVAEDGRVILQKGYGWANMEWEIPNGADTKHRLASITKQFTAALVLQLADEGKLTLDDTVSDHLDYYRKDTGDRMTIHHLLTHTSGLPDFITREYSRSDAVRRPFETDEFVKEYCSGDLEFTPGEKWSISNSGYLVLGAIIQTVTGKRYEDVLQQRIFGPLGMRDSGYDRSETVLLRRAAGYAKTENGYRNARYLDMSVAHAAGALYSTVQDLYRWDRALYGEEVLPNKWKERMFAPHAEVEVQTPDGVLRGHYGYGWVVRERELGEGLPPVQTIDHPGSIFGFSTTIMRVPESGSLIVLLNNTGFVPLDKMTEEILRILYTDR